MKSGRSLAGQRNKFFPERFYHLTTFRVRGFEEPGWEESVAKGAVGVKVWKNIGMNEKTRDGRYIMVDDPLFDNIFSKNSRRVYLPGWRTGRKVTTKINL